MRNDSDAILDDILIRWHQWEPGRVGRGFNDRALVCGEFRVSRQYDDMNGALDLEIEDAIMAQVDFEIEELMHPWRTAIHVLARALTVGCEVFTSPRLPADREEREAIVQQARVQLTQRLLAAGVM